MLIPVLLLFAAAGGILVWTLAGTRQPADGPIDAAGGTNVHTAELSVNLVDRVIVPTFRQLGRKLARLLPPDRLQTLRRKIMLAGKQTSWNVEKAMALKAFGLVAGGAGAVLVLASGHSLKLIVLAFALVCMGYFGTDYYLDKAAGSRQLEIERALPDVLDQISVCVEAGIGFDAALMRCSQSNDNALGTELGRTMQDIRLGQQRKAALYSLLDRTDVQDLRLFVRALVQAEKSGIPIAKVLQIQSDEVREKRRQRAEENAMKLPVKLLLPLILCILPALFTVIMGPAAIRMMDSGVA